MSYLNDWQLVQPGKFLIHALINERNEMYTCGDNTFISIETEDIKALYRAKPSISNFMESQLKCILLEWNCIVTGVLHGEQESFHPKLKINNMVGFYVLCGNWSIRLRYKFNISEHFMNSLF